MGKDIRKDIEVYLERRYKEKTGIDRTSGWEEGGLWFGYIYSLVYQTKIRLKPQTTLPNKSVFV